MNLEGRLFDHRVGVSYARGFSTDPFNEILTPLTTHYSLLTTHYSLFTIHYSLSTPPLTTFREFSISGNRVPARTFPYEKIEKNLCSNNQCSRGIIIQGSFIWHVIRKRTALIE